MTLIPTTKQDDWQSTKRNIELLSRKTDVINYLALVASRLISTDVNKKFVTVADLTAWIAGTVNQIIVTDDGDGTLTLSLPQDIHVNATPEFAGITIKNSSDDIIFYVDDDEMYFTGGAVAIADGMSIGLLLALTYKT